MSDTVDTAVTLRDATEADSDFIAWVQLTASRSHVPVGVWEYVMGIDEAQTLALLTALTTTEAIHWCHHSLFQIAEVDGVPAAALCGFDHTIHGDDALYAALPAVAIASGMTMDDLPAITQRAAISQRCIIGFEPGAWVIENVATRPEFRRRGIMDQLLSSILDRGRDRGFQVAQIKVFIGNEPARAAYVRAGFELVDEKRDDEFEAALGFPGFQRLLQKL